MGMCRPQGPNHDAPGIPPSPSGGGQGWEPATPKQPSRQDAGAPGPHPNLSPELARLEELPGWANTVIGDLLSEVMRLV